MALYDIVSGTTAVASDVEQLIQIFNGKHDIGAVNLAPSISAPSSSSFTLTAQSGNSLGVGAYNYQFTYVTGQYKSDGSTLVQTGETLPSSAVSITTTSGNTTVKITLPTTGIPSSAIAINIYRTSVGGSDYKLVTTIKTGSANYTDSVADASRGSQTPPNSNTTGTTFTQINGYPIGTTQAANIILVTNSTGALPTIGWYGMSGMNGWSNYGQPFNSLQYTKDAAGFVRLRGLVQGGSANTQVSSLPAGMRPLNTNSFITVTSGGTCRIDIGSNGNVSLNGSFSQWIFFDGISFLAEQ